MIDVLLQNLERGPGQNAASIPALEIIPSMHIGLWPGTRNGVMLGKVKAKEFRDWTKLTLSDHTTGFSEKALNTIHGRKYQFQISGWYPGDTEDLRKFLGITEWAKFAVRIRDAHNLVRIIGNNLYGLEMDFDSAIPAEMSGKRGTMISLSGELNEPSSIEY